MTHAYRLEKLLEISFSRRNTLECRMLDLEVTANPTQGDACKTRLRAQTVHLRLLKDTKPEFGRKGAAHSRPKNTTSEGNPLIPREMRWAEDKRRLGQRVSAV